MAVAILRLGAMFQMLVFYCWSSTCPVRVAMRCNALPDYVGLGGGVVVSLGSWYMLKWLLLSGKDSWFKCNNVMSCCQLWTQLDLTFWKPWKTTSTPIVLLPFFLSNCSYLIEKLVPPHSRTQTTWILSITEDQLRENQSRDNNIIGKRTYL